MSHDPTRSVYEGRADEWVARRAPDRQDEPERLAARLGTAEPGPVADLGCGPGWYTAALGPHAVALDSARAMLDEVARHAPGTPRVQADLRSLPFRRHALAGAFASKSYVHLARAEVPMALAELHRATRVGAPVFVHVFNGDMEHGTFADDEFPGRRFSLWPEQLVRDVVAGAGFSIESYIREPGRIGVHDQGRHLLQLTRDRTLADTVGPGMRLLVCGLNPSLHAADVGVGFARPGNRFWPAALAAGVVTVDRDPRHAFTHHGIGMTDLVKRATPRADALSAPEYRAGLARLERLVAWLRPGAVCFVGLAGWRAAVDRHAVAGPQPGGIAGTPAYVMPSTSGLNSHSSLDDLAHHLGAARALAP